MSGTSIIAKFFMSLILEYEHLFPDIPSKTDQIYHDVELIDGSKPVKQNPYRMDPVKQQILREEVQYLLDNDFIEPSQSEWSSPCILVPKPDWTFRMCTDYHTVHSVTKLDTFSIRQMDNCIDNLDKVSKGAKIRNQDQDRDHSKPNMLRNSICLKDFGKYL